MRDPVACTQPGTVTPEDLIAYVDGEADSSIVEHVRSCPSCAAEAGAYGRAEQRLRRGLRRFDCPTPQTIGEYQLGLLEPAERQLVAAHLLDCPRCADELQTLREFLADRTTVASESPIASVAERVKRVVATLVAPPAGPAYAGVRGAGSSASRTYQASDVTVTLGPGPAARRGLASLAGLVWQEGAASDAFAGSEVQLLAEDRVAYHATVDELGNFEIEDVAPRAYDLAIQFPDRIVVVEAVRVGS